MKQRADNLPAVDILDYIMYGKAAVGANVKRFSIQQKLRFHKTAIVEDRNLRKLFHFLRFAGEIVMYSIFNLRDDFFL